MPIMDSFNSGMSAFQNTLKTPYISPTLAAELYKAQTQNKYLDPMLQAELHNKQLINQYYGRDKEADISYKNAEAEASRFKTKYPLLGQTGALGQIGGALYLQAIGANLNGMGGGIASPAGSPSVPSSTPAPVQSQPSGFTSPMPTNNNISSNMPPMNTPVVSSLPAPAMTSNNVSAPSSLPQGGIANPLSQLIIDSVKSTNAQKNAFGNYRLKQTQGYNYMSLPIDYKSQLIAQAAGMGYDPQAATQLFMNGNTIKDLAEAKGIDATNLPEPIYATTKSSLTKIQNRQQALAEMDSLGNTITEWTAPYARRFAGYSTDAILDASKDENSDQLAKFLAARGLSLDQAAIRTRALGGPVGERILNEMVDSAMAKINFPTPLLNTEVYKKTQNYIDSAIKTSVQRANKVGLGMRDNASQNNTSNVDLSKLSDDELQKIAGGSV